MNYENRTGSGYAYGGDCLVQAAISKRASSTDFIPMPPNVNVTSMHPAQTSTPLTHSAYTTRMQTAPQFAATSAPSLMYSYPQSSPMPYYGSAATTQPATAFGSRYESRAAATTSYNARPAPIVGRSQWSFPGAVEQSDLVRSGLFPPAQSSAFELQSQMNPGRRLEVTLEERRRRQVRREKNKVAAAKCRTKRRQHSKQLKEDYEDLEKSTTEIRATIAGLLEEVNNLKAALVDHACVLDEDEKAVLEEQLETLLTESNLATPVNRNDVMGLSLDSDSDDCTLSTSDLVAND